MADLADKVYETTNVSYTCPISTQGNQQFTSSLPPTSAHNFESQFNDLIKRVNAIDSKISKQNNNRSRDRSRSKPRNSKRDKENENDSQECWYHRKFAESAKHCKKPCSFRSRKRESGRQNLPNRVESIGLDSASKRLHIRDRVSGLLFLIDTGSDISLIPVKKNSKREPSDVVLFAANDSRISTFGSRRMTLDLGIRRDFSWNFCVASIPHPILGADFLAHFGLTVDLGQRRLVDSLTQLHSNVTFRNVCTLSIKSINHSFRFQRF